jgi:hypothetical protein
MNYLHNYLHRVTTDPVGVSSFPDVGFLKRCAEFVKEIVVNLLLAFLPGRHYDAARQRLSCMLHSIGNWGASREFHANPPNI